METTQPTGRAGKILLVDDDVYGRDMLRFTLENAGHQVVTASGGLEGLEMASRFRPDVAFVDIMMPGLDGYAVASAMRRDLGTGVWIIALSGLFERRARSWGSGFNLHLQKPIQPSAIEAVVRAALDRPAAPLA
jgi:CheY-like chemotaxis protein